jgi:hypothetical protein
MSDFQTPRFMLDANALLDDEPKSAVHDWGALGLMPRRNTPTMPLDTLASCLRQSLGFFSPDSSSRAITPSSPARPALHAAETPTDPQPPDALLDCLSPAKSTRAYTRPDSSFPARVSLEEQSCAMRDRLLIGDDEAALFLAESILLTLPTHSQALACAEHCRASLERSYVRRVGRLSAIPVPLIEFEATHCLCLDPREAFVLSLLDGSTTIDDMLDISGMPRLDALKILSKLVERDVIWMDGE